MERRGCLRNQGGGIRLPGMFLLAHPLEADGLVRQRDGNKSRVGCCVVGTVMTVAPRSLNMNAAHLLPRKPKHLRDGGSIRINALRVSPHGHHAVLEPCDGT